MASFRSVEMLVSDDYESDEELDSPEEEFPPEEFVEVSSTGFSQRAPQVDDTSKGNKTKKVDPKEVKIPIGKVRKTTIPPPKRLNSSVQSTASGTSSNRSNPPK